MHDDLMKAGERHSLDKKDVDRRILVWPLCDPRLDSIDCCRDDGS